MVGTPVLRAGFLKTGFSEEPARSAGVPGEEYVPDFGGSGGPGGLELPTSRYGIRTAGQEAPAWSGQLNFFHKIRLRVLAVLVAAIFMVIGVVTWAAWPVVPVVGVALLTVAAVVNQMTSKLAEAVCYECGADLKAQQPGVYGVVCPGCGSVNEVVPGVPGVPGDERLFADVGDESAGERVG